MKMFGRHIFESLIEDAQQPTVYDVISDPPSLRGGVKDARMESELITLRLADAGGPGTNKEEGTKIKR